MSEYQVDEYVFFCVNGHANILRGRQCPLNCRQCHALMDVERKYMTVTEYKKSVADMANHISALVETVSKRQEELEDDTDISAFHDNNVTATLTDTKKNVFYGNEAESAFDFPSVESCQTSKKVKIKLSDSDDYHDMPVVAQSRPMIDLLGQKLPLDENGNWIGRNGLGAELLDGCMMISRQHVYIKPDSTGNFIIGPDRSVNGVFFDQGDGKKRLNADDTVLLHKGDTIWLYNIPLKLEENKE